MNSSVSGSGNKLQNVEVYSATPASFSVASLAGLSLLLISITTPAPARTVSGFQSESAPPRTVIECAFEGGLIDFGDEAEAEAETEDQCGARAIINQIHQITISPTGREEDEIAPTPAVCEALFTLLQNTEALIGHLPSGDVSAFYGELSVTWRNGDRMVSVFFDPTGSALHHGCLTKEGVGGYLTEELTAGALAAKLEELQAATPVLPIVAGNQLP